MSIHLANPPITRFVMSFITFLWFAVRILFSIIHPSAHVKVQWGFRSPVQHFLSASVNHFLTLVQNHTSGIRECNSSADIYGHRMCINH